MIMVLWNQDATDRLVGGICDKNVSETLHDQYPSFSIAAPHNFDNPIPLMW